MSVHFHITIFWIYKCQKGAVCAFVIRLTAAMSSTDRQTRKAQPCSQTPRH